MNGHVERRRKCRRSAVNKFVRWCVLLTSAYGLIGKDAGFDEQRCGFNSRCAHFSFVKDRALFCYLLVARLCMMSINDMSEAMLKLTINKEPCS